MDEEFKKQRNLVLAKAGLSLNDIDPINLKFASSPKSGTLSLENSKNLEYNKRV